MVMCTLTFNEAYHYDSHWLAIMIVITQSLAG